MSQIPEAEALRAAIERIRNDLAGGYCTPDRLKANLKICDEAIDDLFGEALPDFEVTLEGFKYIGTARAEVRRRRGHLGIIDGGRT